MNKTEFIEMNLDCANQTKVQTEAQKVTDKIEEMNAEGYKVVSVTTLSSSDFNYEDNENKSYGYGYSYTAGVIIVFEKMVK